MTVRGYRTAASVICQVKDTGIGMSEEDTGRLFSRFFRADSARRSAISGIGLGLSITKAIVEAHGGILEAASTAGTGSTFTLTLPADPTGDTGDGRVRMLRVSVFDGGCVVAGDEEGFCREVLI